MLRFIDLSSSHTLTVSKRHHISPKGLDPGLHLRSTRAKWKCTCIIRVHHSISMYLRVPSTTAFLIEIIETSSFACIAEATDKPPPDLKTLGCAAATYFAKMQQSSSLSSELGIFLTPMFI